MEVAADIHKLKNLIIINPVAEGIDLFHEERLNRCVASVELIVQSL